MERLAKKFLEKTGSIEYMMKVYLKLRRLFQKYGWSEKDLEKSPFITEELMKLHAEYTNLMYKNFEELKEHGFDVEMEEYNSYLRKFMSKINELTPLSDVDYKRTDTGDEDN